MLNLRTDEYQKRYDNKKDSNSDKYVYTSIYDLYKFNTSNYTVHTLFKKINDIHHIIKINETSDYVKSFKVNNNVMSSMLLYKHVTIPTNIHTIIEYDDKIYNVSKDELMLRYDDNSYTTCSMLGYIDDNFKFIQLTQHIITSNFNIDIDKINFGEDVELFESVPIFGDNNENE